MPEPTEIPLPLPLAMIICDTIYEEPMTGKISLLGCFRFLFVKEFPFQPPPMIVYVILTNGRGKVPIRLQLVDVDEEDEPLVENEGELEFKDPTTIIEFEMRLEKFHFPGPGEYRVQLFAGKHFLTERRLEVFQQGKEIQS